MKLVLLAIFAIASVQPRLVAADEKSGTIGNLEKVISFVMPAPDGSAEQKTTELRLSVSFYEKPRHFTDGREEPRADMTTRKSGWEPAYAALRSFEGMSYEEWQRFVSKRYLTVRKVTREYFDMSVEKQKKEKPPPRLSSALYEIDTVFDGRRVCFVVLYETEHLQEQPDDVMKLKYSPNLLAFEKINNQWVVQFPPDTGVVYSLPFFDKQALREIASAEIVTIDQFKKFSVLK